MRIIQRLLNFFFPSFCLRCNSLLSVEEALFCRSCLKDLPLLRVYCRACGTPLSESLLGSFGEEISFCGNCLAERPPFERVFLAFKYESPIRELILKAKFGGDYVLAFQLGRLVRKILGINFKDYDLMLPVPLHPARESERGYNQSLLILWGLRGIHFQRTYISRIKNTLPQSELSLEERRRNVREAFSAGKQVKGKRVLLVDDVMTTGETLREASRALKLAGAEEVQVLAVARAL